MDTLNWLKHLNIGIQIDVILRTQIDVQTKLNFDSKLFMPKWIPISD
jgi:hypothetical protein